MLRQLQIVDYQFLNLVRAMIYMGKSEGFFGYFKGNGVNALRIAPFVACQFYFYELFKGLAASLNIKSVYGTKLLYGGLSGIVTSVAVYYSCSKNRLIL
jgi:solute carrier family 25 phosphate transporter 23/24/25/41